MHMYITESLCCTSETNDTVNQLYASQFFFNKKSYDYSNAHLVIFT